MANRDTRTDNPFRLNLEQQKKRAKDLLRSIRAGEPDALARFREHHPRCAALSDSQIREDFARLAEAQLVIARELDVPSWPALRRHIGDMQASRQAIAADAAPDREVGTLHIRCGTDIEQGLKAAGLTGDFLEYSNPVCQGPIVDSPDWLDKRIDFILSAYGPVMGLRADEAREDIAKAEEALAGAAGRYERVVLWFEHDSYDQFILARCLARFAEAGAPETLELIDIGRFPGAERFVGLGQLPPEALRLLWQRRQSVTPEQLEGGAAVWAALRAADPSALCGLATRGLPALPNMAGALRRHLRELPATRDGLSLTQQIVLTEIGQGPARMGRIFRELMLKRDPLPWLGDTMFFHILDDMLRAEEPAIRIVKKATIEEWPKREIALTAAGEAVLASDRDYMALNPPERWVGGVPIRSGRPVWRYDHETDRVVLT